MPVWIAYFFQVGAGVIAASPEKCGEKRHEVSGKYILASVLAHFEQPIMDHSYSEDIVCAPNLSRKKEMGSLRRQRLRVDR